jgi:hypothetical protein
MRETRQRVADADDNALFSSTSQYIKGFNTSNPVEVFDVDFHYWGRADVMIRIGREFTADMPALLSRNVSNEPTPAPSNTVSADILHLAGFPVAMSVITSLSLFCEALIYVLRKWVRGLAQLVFSLLDPRWLEE